MQHLHLHVGRKRKAFALHLQQRRQAGLVLELLQRFLQRPLHINGVGACSKMQQQFAHIVNAFAQAGVQFIERRLHLQRLLLLCGGSQQLNLNFEKCQGLGNGVMQLPGQQSTLLADRCLAFERRGAQSFECAGKVAGQRIEQFYLVVAEHHRASEEQVYLANQTLLQSNGNADNGLESGLHAVAHRRCFVAGDGNHAGAGILRQAAAGAGSGQQGALFLHQVLRKTVRCQHQVTLIGLVRPTHRHGIGLHDLAHAPRKTFGQIFYRIGTCQKSAHFVQGFNPCPLRFNMMGLGRDLCLQALVESLQSGRHDVKAGGDLTKFVRSTHLHPGTEVPRLHVAQTLVQIGQRIDHIQVAGVQHHHRAANGQRHHHELKQIEDGSELG